MAELIFYGKVVSIDSKLHKKFRIKPVDNFSFSAKTNSVPLVAIEFVEAAREFPIVFIKGIDNSFLPIALLGLRQSENLFVGSDGHWLGRYIPAFIRRYPFVPSEVGQGQVVVCFDEDASEINQEEGEFLFDGDQPGETLRNMIALLKDYQFQALRTKELCQRLSENNLLFESNAQAELADGTSFRLSSLYVVDEKQLQELDKDTVHTLFTSGELGLIYAHLMSLGNLQRLLENLGTRVAT